ncbi:MAG: hypothetical protein QOD41_4203 [Cryptosporangiaceae bacterium]|nr:hypothetical protein [Cryptosporangiaceae bacterium]
MSTVAHGVAMPSLVRWGVSADADLVYRALASFGAREAGVIAVELGLSASRTRQALDELTAIGAAAPRAAVWRAAPPAQVVEQVRARRIRAQAAVDPVARYVQVLRDAGIGEAASVRPDLRVRILGGVDATRRRLAALADAAAHEHLSIHPETVHSGAATAAAAQADEPLLDRGVRVATVCLPPADGDAYSQRMLDSGMAARFASSLPLKLILVDRRHAILPLDPLDRSKGAIEVADPAAVEVLASVFRREWASGRDPERGAVAPIVLSGREEDLIRLLAAGQTDEVAARRLKVSPRTVTTLVRALMDRLGVENRFQLGLALGARATELPGLLPPDRQRGTAGIPAQRRGSA